VSEVNWSALKKQANDATRPAPVGEHVVEIKKCSWKLNSSGNPMYSVQANVVEGPAEGKTIFNNFNLTTENSFAMAIFFRHMEALGLGDAFFAAGPSHDQVCQALVGRRAVFSVDIRQWQGQDRNNVTDVKPLSGAQATAAAMVGVHVLPAVPTPGGSGVSGGTSAGAPQNIQLPPAQSITVPTPTTPAPITPFDVTPTH
jgi:hypothetical protein